MPPGALQYQILLHSDYRFFAGKSLSGEKAKPRISTDCCLGKYRVHSSNAPKQFCDEISFVAVPHPPCGPDLASLDLWLFGPIKRIFNDAHKLFEAVIEF
jgi:hypothetical protein